MLIRQKDAFYLEHGGRRRGYYNSRVVVTDKGQRDNNIKQAYKAEARAEEHFGAASTVINSPLKHYIVASIVDHITTQPSYTEWFGATHLLVIFNSRRSRSVAWKGCIEFADHATYGLAWFDIYHELAHHVTLKDNEPAHGERFIGAMLLIASLSPFAGHAHRLAICLRKEGLYPTSTFFEENFCI